MSAVEVEDLSHSYGERRALVGVSFTVAEGEMFALLGPNGGGKTTLFRILSTLIPPQAGTARIFGADVAADPAEVRRRRYRSKPRAASRLSASAVNTISLAG